MPKVRRNWADRIPAWRHRGIIIGRGDAVGHFGCRSLIGLFISKLQRYRLATLKDPPTEIPPRPRSRPLRDEPEKASHASAPTKGTVPSPADSSTSATLSTINHPIFSSSCNSTKDHLHRIHQRIRLVNSGETKRERKNRRPSRGKK
jgi:hypothetical protein